jgi:hypothetical protein
MRLKVGKNGIIDNQGDALGDNVEPMPNALKELRAATLATSQRIFSQTGGNRPTKILARRQTGAAAVSDIGKIYQVTGYFTLLKYLANRTPQEMEGVLGLGPRKLSVGVDILIIVDQLSSQQFAPRYTTAWSAGASPRDLGNFGARYHPDYPPASEPVYQWVIYRNKPARARKIATLAYNEKFITHTR